MNSADAFTVRLLDNAGIAAGERILDIGCGTGAVTQIIAERVGETGEVVGIDRNEAALHAARDAFAETGMSNVSFVAADLHALPPDLGSFDVIVGRRVLMYQPDLTAALRASHAVLRPGGRLAFQEHDATGTPVHTSPLPLHEHIHHLMFETVRREGADTQIGYAISPALRAAGFTVTALTVQATVLSPVMTHPIERIVSAMESRMIATGLLAPGALAIEDLDDRLASERRAADATCLWEHVFGIHACRKKVP